MVIVDCKLQLSFLSLNIKCAMHGTAYKQAWLYVAPPPNTLLGNWSL